MTIPFINNLYKEKKNTKVNPKLKIKLVRLNSKNSEYKDNAGNL